MTRIDIRLFYFCGSVVMMNPGSANFKRGAEGGINDDAIISAKRVNLLDKKGNKISMDGRGR